MQRQARAPETQPFGAEAFGAADTTVLRWLGMAGLLINSRGTTVMVDPLLGGFDTPVMIEFPISADNVPRLEAVLVTHSDNDHYSVPTCRDLAGVTSGCHSTQYVASLMKQQAGRRTVTTSATISGSDQWYSSNRVCGWRSPWR